MVFVAVRAFPQEFASARRERDAFSIGPVHDRGNLPLCAGRFHFAASKVGRIAVDAVIAGPDMLIGPVGATVQGNKGHLVATAIGDDVGWTRMRPRGRSMGLAFPAAVAIVADADKFRLTWRAR